MLKGLTPEEKDLLRREKKRLRELYDMDMEEWKELQEPRKAKEEQVMYQVSSIFARPVL